MLLGASPEQHVPDEGDGHAGLGVSEVWAGDPAAIHPCFEVGRRRARDGRGDDADVVVNFEEVAGLLQRLHLAGVQGSLFWAATSEVARAIS